MIVKFGKSFTSEQQGEILLQTERACRDRGLDVRVLKETMPDDSKLRRLMTLKERENL